MNIVAISGRICHEPELKTTNSGKAVLAIRLAVDRPHVKDVTDFIPCIAWEGTAKYLASYAKKGTLIEVVGELQSRTYEKDGKNVTVYEVRISETKILTGGKDKTPVKSEAPQEEVPAEESVENDDEELPF